MYIDFTKRKQYYVILNEYSVRNKMISIGCYPYFLDLGHDLTFYDIIYIYKIRKFTYCKEKHLLKYM